MTRAIHDPGHARILAALKLLPWEYRERVKSFKERIDKCNSLPVASFGEEHEILRFIDGPVVTHGWHCNSPLCHKACVTKSEKFIEKYLPRAISRVKYRHRALTFTTIPEPGLPLREAYLRVEHARKKLFANPEFKKLSRGGAYRIDFTDDDRVSSPEVGTERSWFVHIHIIADGNLNKRQASRLQWFWANYLQLEGSARPVKEYAKEVENFSGYMRYLRKDLDYSKWSDEELAEACRFFLAEKAPVLNGVFGSWNDRTSDGRPYGAAKRELSSGDKAIPEIPFSTIYIAHGKKTEKHDDSNVIVEVEAMVSGVGLGVVEAAAAELVSASLHQACRTLKRACKMDTEVIGARTGTVYKLKDVQSFNRVPPDKIPKLRIVENRFVSAST